MFFHSHKSHLVFYPLLCIVVQRKKEGKFFFIMKNLFHHHVTLIVRSGAKWKMEFLTFSTYSAVMQWWMIPLFPRAKRSAVQRREYYEIFPFCRPKIKGKDESSYKVSEYYVREWMEADDKILWEFSPLLCTHIITKRNSWAFGIRQRMLMQSMQSWDELMFSLWASMHA